MRTVDDIHTGKRLWSALPQWSVDEDNSLYQVKMGLPPDALGIYLVVMVPRDLSPR